MRVENWNGYDIRFIEVNGEWYAILKDICDALGLRTDKVADRLDPSYLERVRVYTDATIPTKYNTKDDHLSKGVVNFKNHTKAVYMLAVNEAGVYEALFASRKLEARKFRQWTAGILQKLRKYVGLEGYEVMRMTESDIQDQIDWILDSLYWDEEKKCLMQSITVQGGDVEQVPFEV